MTDQPDSADDVMNSPEPSPEEEDPARRDFLKGVSAAAAGGATMLAGCSGGGGGGGDGGDGGDGGGESNDGGGSSGGGSSTSETVHFISMEQSPAFKEFWNKTASQFEEQSGTSVNVTYAWDTGYNKRIAQLLQAGDPPDVINLEEFNVGQYVTQNLLADVTDVVDEFQNKTNFPSQYRIDNNGGDRWFPSFCAPNVRWYRGDVMSDVGFEGSSPLGTPTTYEEWGNFMQTVDESRDDMAGGGIATGATFLGTNTTLCHIWASGARTTQWASGSNEEIEVALPDYTEEIQTALDHLKSNYQYSADTANWSWTETTDAFANGDIAESFYGGARPQVQAHKRGRSWSKDVTLGPFPNNPDADNAIDYTFPSGWGIMSGGQSTESAKDYVSMIMMDDELLTEFYQITPVHNAPLSEARRDPSHPMWDVPLVNESMTEEQLGFYLDQIPRGQPIAAETSPPNYEASSAFTTFGLGDMVYQYVNQDASIDDAIQTAVTTMQGAL